MSKLSKFRKAPTRFFQDSSNAFVRSLGKLALPVIERPSIRALLEDPHLHLYQVFANFGVPGEMLEIPSRHRLRALSARGRPLVSVVVAAYNAEHTIAAALESILAQSYSELEVIVVDDCSTDATAAIVSRISESDSRVFLLRSTQQLGAARARNLGLHRAAGEYLTFHDADDQSDRTKIEQQLYALLSNPEKVICVCNYRRESAEGSVVEINGERFGKSAISMLIRRDPVFTRVGYMLPFTIAEDTEYYHRIRATFGAESEAHLFRTLYHAQYSPSSLLFSSGRTTESKQGVVSFQRPETADAWLVETFARAEAIRAGKLDPFVPFDLALS